MTVSVIVPNYNHSKYLPQRIESILSQTFSDFEIIILDDSSTDNSIEIISRYASFNNKIKYFTNPANSGSPFAQWQKGISLAKGEFIWIAESDDFAESTFLERCIGLMRKHENAGIVFCNSLIINEEDSTKYLVSDKESKEGNSRLLNDYYNKGSEEISEHMYRRNTIYNVSSVLFRRSKLPLSLDKVTAMIFCGDWLLYIKVLLHSDIAYISEPLNNFRIHAESSSKKYFNSSKYLREVIAIYKLVVKHLKINPGKYFLMALFLLKISRRIILGRDKKTKT